MSTQTESIFTSLTRMLVLAGAAAVTLPNLTQPNLTSPKLTYHSKPNLIFTSLTRMLVLAGAAAEMVCFVLVTDRANFANLLKPKQKNTLFYFKF
jgi:hypothetical protein